MSSSPYILHELDYPLLAQYIVQRESNIRIAAKTSHTVAHVDSICIIASDVEVDIALLEDAVTETYRLGGYTYMQERYRPLLMENTGLVRIVTKSQSHSHDSFRTFITNSDIYNGDTPFQWYIFSGDYLLDILHRHTTYSFSDSRKKDSAPPIPDVLINTGLFIGDRFSITATAAYADIIPVKIAGLTYSRSMGFEPEIYYQHCMQRAVETHNVSPITRPVVATMHWLNHVCINTADYRDTTSATCSQCAVLIYGKYYQAYGRAICKFCAHRSNINSSESAPVMVRESPATIGDTVTKLDLDPAVGDILSQTDYYPAGQSCYANAKYLLFAGTVVAYIKVAHTINSDPQHRKKVLLIKSIVP